MVRKELVKYIREGMNQGVSLIKLKKDLLDRGWSAKDVSEALKSVNSKSSSSLFHKIGLKNFILFFLIFFVVVVLIFILALNAQNTAEVYSSDILEKGVNVDMKRSLVEFEYSEGKSEEARLVSANTLVAEIDLGGKKVKIKMGENKSLDIDSDGFVDLVITYESIKGSVPTFFIQSSDLEIDKSSESDEKIESLKDKYKVEEIDDPVVEEEENETCVPDWSCGNWESCVNGQQERSCEDSNDCGVLDGVPDTVRTCEEDDDSGDDSEECVEEWNCTYSDCINGIINKDCNEVSCGGGYKGSLVSCEYNESTALSIGNMTKEEFCISKSPEDDNYFYFDSNNETHFCQEPKEFTYYNVSCCANETLLERFNSTAYIMESESLCGTGYTEDCGSTDFSIYDKVAYPFMNSVSYSLLFGRDCSMVTFENALRDNCSASKLTFNSSNDSGNSNVVSLELLGELPDGNCSINFTIDSYEINESLNFSVNGTSMNCQLPVTDEWITVWSCPLGFCVEPNMPGSSILMMLGFFQSIVEYNDVESYLCYGNMTNITGKIQF